MPGPSVYHGFGISRSLCERRMCVCEVVKTRKQEDNITFLPSFIINTIVGIAHRWILMNNGAFGYAHTKPYRRKLLFFQFD